jgi:hypothetical protein
MNNEYIIVNKTALENRIKELIYEKYQSISREHIIRLSTQIIVLEQIMSQSTPLIPKIEKAFEAGRKLTLDSFEEEDFQDYENHISNLKLDI